MKMVDIRNMAKSFGIKPNKMKKVDLIRTIQRAEWNVSCFQTNASVQCSQERCCWRDGCLMNLIRM